MDDWKVANSRVTLFPDIVVGSAPQAVAMELYRAIWGADPDNFQKQPNPMLPSSSAQGRIGKAMATCMVQASRVDFNLAPAPPVGTTITRDSFPLFDDLKQVRRELHRIIDGIGSGLPPILRVSLYFHIVKLAPDAASANRLLVTAIPKQYAPTLENEEDFVLQINRPYQRGEAPQVKMNAVLKWSVDRLQIVTYSIPITAAQIPAISGGLTPAGPKTEEVITASIAFDLNNVPLGRALSSGEQASLLREAMRKATALQRDIGIEEG